MQTGKKIAFVLLPIAVIGMVALWNFIRVERLALSKPLGATIENIEIPNTKHAEPISKNAEKVIEESNQSYVSGSELVSIPLDDPDVKNTIRAEYRNSPDLPDGISFSLTLASIGTPVEDDPEYAIYAIMEDMGVEYDEAEELASKLTKLHLEFTNKVKEVQIDLLCEGEIPKVYGDDVYVAMEKVEQIRDDTANEMFLSFMNDLPDSQVDSFIAWNDEAKLSTTSVRFDYKKYYELRNKDGNVFTARFCSSYSEL